MADLVQLQMNTSLSGYNGNRYPLIKSGSLSERSSRTSSFNSIGSGILSSASSSPNLVDYRILYERERLENEKLTRKLKHLEVLAAQHSVDQQVNGTSPKITTSGIDKSLERRIAELEHVTASIEQLRRDNQRLKEENGALIRVISKLSG